MILMHVKPEIIQYSIDYAKIVNLGNRLHSNGTSEQQLTGIIGENTILDAFDLPLMDGCGHDNGYDLIIEGKKFDIKTINRKGPVLLHYANNLMAEQLKYDVYGYIFCSLNTDRNTLHLCGWIPKFMFIKLAKFHKKGSKKSRHDGSIFIYKMDTYEILNSQLLQIDKIDDLKKQITYYETIEFIRGAI